MRWATVPFTALTVSLLPKPGILRANTAPAARINTIAVNTVIFLTDFYMKSPSLISMRGSLQS